MATSPGKKLKAFPGIRLKKAERKAVAGMLDRGTWPAQVLRHARVLQLLDRGWCVTDIFRATEAFR
jgi:hypothetical protein